ncbi:MAG: hypothetical protein LBS50_06725 [Prevotellaceae bacterium]|nr:hypothetical protein [Prevotellaceae bacterium]
MKSATNFSITGTVHTQPINVINGGGTNSTFTTAFKENNPDIIIIGFDYHPDAAVIDTLANFVNIKKGFLLMLSEADVISEYTSNSALLTKILGSSVTVEDAPNPNGGGTMRPFITDDTNPLINGPFFEEGLGGKYWGEDATRTDCIRTLPPGCVSLSTVQTNVYTIVWKENANFVYIGDGGFGAGNLIDISSVIYPCTINALDSTPRPKTQYNNIPNVGGVYNSYFFANIIAYAIKWVQENKM